jgi:hypothetical protein
MKNLKIILLIFFFLNGESSQNVGAGARGGYACPIESTAVGQASSRSLGTDEGATLGAAQAIFTNVQINGYNFCRHEAEKAIADGMCNFCTNTKNLTADTKIQDMISPGSMGEKLKDGKDNPEACQSKLTKISNTDCGSTCIVNIRCMLTGILNRITVLGQTFANFYNDFIEAEKNYHDKLAEFYQANKTSIHDQIKIWLINTIADQYARAQLNMSNLTIDDQVDLISKKLVAYDAQADAAQPAKPEKFISEQCGKDLNSNVTSTAENRSSALIELCTYRKKLFDNWEETFAAAVGCRAAQNKDKPSCQMNAEKYLENIFDLLLKNHAINEYTEMFDNYPLYMFAWHTLTTNFAESSASEPVNKVINRIKQLSCFFQSSNQKIKECQNSNLSGVDWVNGLITTLFTDQEPAAESPFKNKINKDVLQQVLNSTAGANYLKTLQNILSPDSNDLKMPAAKLNDIPTVKNGDSTLLYGRNVPLNSYVTNYKDLSVIMVKLLASVDSPLIKILNLYVQQYMEYCTQCVTDPANLQNFEETETAVLLCIFECKHLIEKAISKIKELNNKKININKDQVGTKTNVDPVKTVEPKVSVEPEVSAAKPETEFASRVNEIKIEPPASVGEMKPVAQDSVAILEKSAVEVTQGLEVGAGVVAKGAAEKVIAEGAAEGAAGAAAGAAGGSLSGPLMMAYMFGAAICSEIKPDEKWCDPLTEIVDLDIQSCANFNLGNAPTMPGNSNINPSQLIRPDCTLIDAVDLTYKYVVKNIPVAVGYIAQGLCYAFNGFNGKAYSDKDVCNDVESKVAEGINKGIEIVGKVFATGFGNLITGIVDVGLGIKGAIEGKRGGEIKPILYPWEKSGSINSDNRTDSIGVITGLALGAIIVPGASTLAVVLWELFRRGMNTAKTGCGTTGDNGDYPDQDCEWVTRPGWLPCCQSPKDSNTHNTDCSGTWNHGGLLRAC